MLVGGSYPRDRASRRLVSLLGGFSSPGSHEGRHGHHATRTHYLLTKTLHERLDVDILSVCHAELLHQREDAPGDLGHPTVTGKVGSSADGTLRAHGWGRQTGRDKGGVKLEAHLHLHAGAPEGLVDKGAGALE